MAETQLVLSTVVKGTETATKALNDVKKSMDGISTATKDASGKLAKAKEWFATLGIGAGIVTAGIVAGIKETVGTFADFEAKMSGIKAVLSPTTKEFEKMTAKARELGKTTQYTASQAADSMEMLAKNGLDATQILGGATDATLALAASTGADLATAADIASSAMLIFGKTTKDLDQVVNSITGTTNVSKFGIEDYSLALAQGWGVAATVGVNFQDFNASIAAISPLFQSGSDAGTSFKTFLLRLKDSTAPASKAMQDLGLLIDEGGNKFFDATGKMKSMAEVSQILKDATKDLSDEKKLEALNTIFGTDAMRAAAGMAWVGEEAFKKMSNTIETTDAMKNAKDRTDNFKGAMERLNGQMDDIKITVGQALAPALGDLMAKISKILVPVAKWMEENPKLAAQIILVTGAIAGLVAGVTALTFVIGLMMSPVVLITAAIAILAGAAYLCWQNWDAVKPKLLQFWEDLKVMIPVIVEAMGVYVLEKFEEIKKWILEIVEAIGKYVIDTFARVTKTVGDAIDYVAGMAGKAKAYVSSILESVGSVGLWISDGLSGALSGARANGGPVGGGRSYLVGERGPEIFTPSGSGQIIPNDRIGGMGGGIIINITGMFWSDAAEEISQHIVKRLKGASYI